MFDEIVILQCDPHPLSRSSPSQQGLLLTPACSSPPRPTSRRQQTDSLAMEVDDLRGEVARWQRHVDTIGRDCLPLRQRVQE